MQVVWACWLRRMCQAGWTPKSQRLRNVYGKFLTRNNESNIMPGARCDVGVRHQMSPSSVFHFRHVRHFTLRHLHRHTWYMYSYRHCHLEQLASRHSWPDTVSRNICNTAENLLVCLMAAAPVFLNWRLRNVQYDMIWYDMIPALFPKTHSHSLPFPFPPTAKSRIKKFQTTQCV